MPRPIAKKDSPFWHYDFRVAGARLHGSTRTGNKRLAQQLIDRIHHDALLPTRARPPITLDEAAGLYADHAETLPSWPTIRYLLAALVKGLGKDRLLSEITQRDLIAFIAKRRIKARGPTPSGLPAEAHKMRANSSINREIENARAVWRKAEAARFDVGDVPDWGALRLKTQPSRWQVLGQGIEEGALLRAVRDDVRDAVRFLLLSGWRRMEMLGLCWNDLDLPNRTAWTRIKGGADVERPLTADMLVLIANQPRIGPRVFTYVCERASGGVAGRAGRRHGQRYPLTATVLRAAFEAARQATGLDTLRLHDLRHTRATRLLRTSGDIALTKTAMAHRSLKTTLRYAHVMNEDVREALENSDSRTTPEAAKSTQKKSQ